MKEAMANVKAELGDDAVILHTKRYRKGGLMGFRSKEIVEIIAAVEDQAPAERINIATSGRTQESRIDISTPATSMEEYNEQQKAVEPEEEAVPEIVRIKDDKETAISPLPIRPPMGVLNQYQTAGTAKQVQKAQNAVDELHRGATTLDDVMAAIRQQQKSNYDARTIAAKEEESIVPPSDADYEPPYYEDYPMPEDEYGYYDEELIKPKQTVSNKNTAAVENAETSRNVKPANEEVAPVKEAAPVNEKVTADEVVTPVKEETAAKEIAPVSEDAAEDKEKTVIVEDSLADKEATTTEEDKASTDNAAAEKNEEKPVAAENKTKNIKNTKNEAIEKAVEEAFKPEKKIEPPKPEQLSANPEEDGKDDKIQQLQDELAQMKAMLSHAMSGAMAEEKVSTLQIALKEHEVEDRIIQDMISRLTGAEIVADKNTAKAKAALEKYLRKTVRVANGITLLSGRPKIVALIGATGVGKTTTLAKIAAKFVLEQGVSAAMITADTYRISAVEQLKTYSDIIGLPLEIVYSPDALKKAIEKHANKQLILIDTAGRSQYNEYQMKELCDLISVDKAIEKYLVMSATTKNRDAESILEHFSVCKPDRVIFTKTDETSSVGLILNLLYKKKIALSYLTNGQNVPSDIYPASIEKLAELLLK